MDHTALILIDLQNDMIHERGAYGAGGFSDIVADRGLLRNVFRVLSYCREAGMITCYVRLGYRADYSDCLSRASRIGVLKERKAAILGEWGSEIHEEVAPVAGERVFAKQSVNAFWNTQLLNWLFTKRVRTVVLAGVATHLAVESAARFADDAGLEVIVLEDCCASGDMQLHHFAVKSTLPLFGRVLTSHDFLSLADSGGPPGKASQ
jgi:nicotinamidase-related amidase